VGQVILRMAILAALLKLATKRCGIEARDSGARGTSGEVRLGFQRAAEGVGVAESTATARSGRRFCGRSV
jgi:hypothetical protein